MRYRIDAVPFNSTLCHCADCRRAAGAPAVAWFSVAMTGFRLMAGEPKAFASSAAAMRGFCADCGTSLTFRSTANPDEIDVTTASLADPEAVPPRDQVWTSRTLSWIAFADRIPKHARTR